MNSTTLQPKTPPSRLSINSPIFFKSNGSNFCLQLKKFIFNKLTDPLNHIKTARIDKKSDDHTFAVPVPISRKFQTKIYSPAPLRLTASGSSATKPYSSQPKINLERAPNSLSAMTNVSGTNCNKTNSSQELPVISKKPANFRTNGTFNNS